MAKQYKVEQEWNCGRICIVALIVYSIQTFIMPASWNAIAWVKATHKVKHQQCYAQRFFSIASAVSAANMFWPNEDSLVCSEFLEH